MSIKLSSIQDDLYVNVFEYKNKFIDIYSVIGIRISSFSLY